MQKKYKVKILITGIYGFLGCNLANQLSKENEVIGLYNANKNSLLNTSIATFSNIEEIQFKPNVIVMCHAAVVSGNTQLSNDTLFNTNVEFTNKILNYFPEVKIIYISSVSVFGNYDNEKITEQTSVNPLNDYAKSKLAAEQLCLIDDKNVVIRFSSLYGNGMKENTLIPNYVNQALKNNKIEVWGKGLRYQNYIHVDDAVSLIEKVVYHNKKISFPVLGVDSKEYSNKEVAEIIAEKTNAKINFINNDNSASFFYNNTVSKNVLNWQPNFNLIQGINNYLKWKEKQY